MNDLFRKAAIFGLAVITTFGMAGAMFATAPTANALTTSQINSIISLLQSFGADQATIDNVQTSLEGGTPSTGGSSGSSGSTAAACDFNRDLFTGRSGSDVKCLQEYLNSAGYTVADSGVGSPGNETDYFGSLTEQAVIAWQNANAANVLQPVGLSTGTGYWGNSSISYYNQIAGDTSGGSDSGDSSVSTPGSGVEVTSEALSNITVPRNATLITIGEFTFASGENTDITGLHFERKGAGQRTDWDKLYVYDGSERLTSSGRTINTDQELDFTNLNVDLDDGEAKTLTLRGTVSSSNQGNVHSFDLESVDFDDSDVSVSGLPVSSRQVTLANATTGSLDVDYNAPVDTTVELGDKDVEIFNADLTGSTEDMDLKSFILEQYGSVDVDELDNFKVMLDGTEATDANVTVNGDEIQITFDGDGYFIEDGDNVELALHADMTSGAYIKGGTGIIELNVDESSNVDAVGRDFGYGVNITHTDGFGNPSGTSQEVTIQASEINFTFEGPQTNDIGLNTDDVVLFETDVVTQADIEFDNLSFRFDVDDTNNPVHLQNLKLRNKDTGEVYAGPDEIASTTSNVDHNFDDVFILDEGENTLQIIADIGNDTVNGAELTVSLLVDASGSSDDLDAENLDTSENIDITADVIPADILTGKKQTLTQADLTIADDATAQTFVVGKTSAVLGSYVLQASGVSNIDVRQLKFDFSVSSSTAAALTGSLTLRKGSVTGEALDSESVTTGSSEDSLTFDTSGSLDIPAGGDETVHLIGDLKSDFDSANLGAGNTESASTTVTDVTAKDSDNQDPLFNGVSESNLTDVAGTTHTIAGSGSFDTVAFSGDNPSENEIITPGSNILFSSYRLRPQNEDIQMRDWVVNIVDSSDSDYFSRVRAIVDGVEVDNEPITGATATFEDVNVDLTKDEDATFNFEADLKDDFNNLISGAELQLYFSTTTTNYDIVGLDSGSSVTFATGSIDTANEGIRTYQLANSYPTFTVKALDSGTLTNASNQNLFKFDVTANDGQIDLRKISFDISVNESSSSTNGNLQVSGIELLRGTRVVGTVTTTDSDTDGTFGETADGGSETASATVSIDNTSDYTIGSGKTVSFTLRGDVTGAGDDDANSITVSINNDDEDGTLVVGSNDSDTTGISSTTIWSDTYVTSNGAYIDFPTDSTSLSR